MGRAFEKRKYKMFARYDKMAKQFTRIGKEIVMAVKNNGPDPDSNPRLRTAIINAKGVNMPKDRIDAAIKRASNRDEKNFEEVIYEGHGPYGIPILVECATDNPTRTVANVRMYFNKNNGQLGTSGSVSFMFQHKGVFVISNEGLNMEELEMDLIDAGAEDIQLEEDNQVTVYTQFQDYGAMIKALEEKKLKVISSKLEWIPDTFAEVTEEQEHDLLKLIDAIEEDDDVQAVYHNLP